MAWPVSQAKHWRISPVASRFSARTPKLGSPRKYTGFMEICFETAKILRYREQAISVPSNGPSGPVRGCLSSAPQLAFVSWPTPKKHREALPNANPIAFRTLSERFPLQSSTQVRDISPGQGGCYGSG